MIAILTMAALIAAQQSDTIPGLPPAVRAMVAQFPTPKGNDVAIDSRFSNDTVWIGEQVELVTAAWFPRDLRDRLRRSPTLRAPELSGLWSAPDGDNPELAETRRVGRRIFDLFVSHKTLFPLGAGTIEAPAAVLSYSVPASASFFAPETQKSLSSRPVNLQVRPIPAALASQLGNGPTAQGINITWKTPSGVLAAGTPIPVALTISGIGNVTLWPDPEIVWPGGVRIYPEPVEENLRRTGGLISGEKTFHYSLVADSAGVLTLPRVRYPHFDPKRVEVRVASARARGLVIRPPGTVSDRKTVLPAIAIHDPVLSTVVRSWWPALLLLGLLPIFIKFWPRRLPDPTAPRLVALPLEVELRLLLRTPGDATPSRVEEALRRRGISRTEASAVGKWLHDLDRQRWGADDQVVPDDSAARSTVATLKRTLMVLAFILVAFAPGSLPAQWSEGMASLAEGDALSAESQFMTAANDHPEAAAVWLNLGVARWEMGDDIGAAAAWIQGTRVAPRSRALNRALAMVTTMPDDLKHQVPTVPFSRDEFILGAFAGWFLGWFLWRRRRTWAQLVFVLALLSLGTALQRTLAGRAKHGLVRRGATLTVSPVVNSPTIKAALAWSSVTIDEVTAGWYLVSMPDGSKGWLPAKQVATFSPLD